MRLPRDIENSACSALLSHCRVSTHSFQFCFCALWRISWQSWCENTPQNLRIHFRHRSPRTVCLLFLMRCFSFRFSFLPIYRSITTEFGKRNYTWTFWPLSNKKQHTNSILSTNYPQQIASWNSPQPESGRGRFSLWFGGWRTTDPLLENNMWEPKLPLALLSARSNFGSHMLVLPRIRFFAFFCVVGFVGSAVATFNGASKWQKQSQNEDKEGKQKTLTQMLRNRIRIWIRADGLDNQTRLPPHTPQLQCWFGQRAHDNKKKFDPSIGAQHWILGGGGEGADSNLSRCYRWDRFWACWLLDIFFDHRIDCLRRHVYIIPWLSLTALA